MVCMCNEFRFLTVFGMTEKGAVRNDRKGRCVRNDRTAFGMIEEAGLSE